MEMVEHITPLPMLRLIEGGLTRGGHSRSESSNPFGFDKAPHTIRTRLIVTNHNGRVIGLIVDSAREFMSISNGAIQPRQIRWQG